MGFAAALTAVALAVWHTISAGGGIFGPLFLPTVSLAIPLLMPNLRWLAGSVAFYALAVLAVFVEYQYATSLPTYSGSPGEALGLSLIALGVIGFAVGAVMRTGIHLVWARFARSPNGESDSSSNRIK